MLKNLNQIKRKLFKEEDFCHQVSEGVEPQSDLQE